MTETELNALLAGITPANEAARAAAHAHWASLAKPLGGLGRLETMLEDAAALTGSAELDLSRRVVVVLCADNGVVAQGVSQTGQEVTRAVAENLAMRRTSVCQMARTAHCDVLPVDMGMAGEPVPGVRSCRIAAGTADFTQGPAMSRAEAVQAVGEGIALARELAEDGYRLIATGEMGIGNTTTSSAVAAVLLGQPVELMTGRGAGLSDEGLARKVDAICRGILCNEPDPEDTLDVLSKLGGFDIAGLCGVFLGGALAGVPVLADGFISGVAALCAVLGYLVAQPLYYAAIALAVLAVVLLVAANNGKKRAQQAAAALGELLRSYGAQDADGIYYQAEVHRAAYRACAAAMETERRAAAALEDAREHQCETHERLLQSLDFESGTGEAAALYQRRSALESVCTRLRTQQAQLTGAALAIGDPMALGSEHAQLLEQRDALERQYAAIALAIETLGRADAELQSRFSPQLAQKAADYMDYLTDGRYDELVLARDLSAKARSADDPTPRDTAYLSAGTADLLYLSVRLALCELTCPADDPCPLVLDDTLVNFDDARAGRAMALFREIAQHRQVILFTCHERDCPAQA